MNRETTMEARVAGPQGGLWRMVGATSSRTLRRPRQPLLREPLEGKVERPPARYRPRDAARRAPSKGAVRERLKKWRKEEVEPRTFAEAEQEDETIRTLTLAAMGSTGYARPFHPLTELDIVGRFHHNSPG